MLRKHLTRTRLGLLLAVAAGVLLGAILGQPSSGVAAGTATKPKNVTPPTITGTAEVGQRLVATRGTWTGKPTSFHFQWIRCDADGACATIGGATKKTYVPTSADVGHTLEATVTARNAAGASSAASAPTAVVSPSGCPPGTATIQATQLAPPARLDIAGATVSPSVTRSTRSLHLHVTITACGRAVQGATVFATAVPYNQFGVGQATTDASGKVTLTEQRRAGFPATRHQRLLAVFVRATKTGDPPLGGVSSRRLFAFHFGHH
jgi:Ig domain of plant-specific actin-binding protein